MLSESCIWNNSLIISLCSFYQSAEMQAIVEIVPTLAEPAITVPNPV